MEYDEDIMPTVWDEKLQTATTIGHITQARLLESAPVVRRISAWCRKHNRSRKGMKKPTLAVIYFDTGADSRLYMHYKVAVGVKVDVRVTGHKLLPDVPVDAVLDTISELNDDDSVDGILIQRPLPEHLCEHEVMDSVAPRKHIEEFTRGKASNIALDALTRVLDHHGKATILKLNVILLGGLNIITPKFKAELKQRYARVESVEMLEPDMLGPKHDTVIITELNKGGVIRADMLGPAIKLVVDLGFDGVRKMGDLGHDVLDMDDLLVVPSPGGVLPVLLWIMMERTIRARHQRELVQVYCLPACNVV